MFDISWERILCSNYLSVGRAMETEFFIRSQGSPRREMGEGGGGVVSSVDRYSGGRQNGMKPQPRDHPSTFTGRKRNGV